jgi:hypothetical protein
MPISCRIFCCTCASYWHHSTRLSFIAFILCNRNGFIILCTVHRVNKSLQGDSWRVKFWFALEMLFRGKHQFLMVQSTSHYWHFFYASWVQWVLKICPVDLRFEKNGSDGVEWISCWLQPCIILQVLVGPLILATNRSHQLYCVSCYWGSLACIVLGGALY